MNRRDRILTALDGGVPDRPPIAFDCQDEVLAGLLAHYGAADKNDLYRVAGIDGFSVWEWNAITAPGGTKGQALLNHAQDPTPPPAAWKHLLPEYYHAAVW